MCFRNVSCNFSSSLLLSRKSTCTTFLFSDDDPKCGGNSIDDQKSSFLHLSVGGLLWGVILSDFICVLH